MYAPQGRVTVEQADELAGIATEKAAVLVLPEAHHYLPNIGNYIEGDNLETLVTEWRHAKAGLWLDSQRFAAISARAIEACHVWSMFAMVGPNDLKRVYGEGGQELVDAIKECARRFAEPINQPGWHVEYRPAVKLPPYELVRV